MPIAFKGLLVQYAGRIHRIHPDKIEVRVYDYVDDQVPMLRKMFDYRKLHLDRTPTQTVKTTTGYMRVSTPEGTAVDLVRYMRQSGHLQHIATVLVELAESLDAGRLVEAAKADGTIANAQRLGYLLDLVEAERRPRDVLLPVRIRDPASARPSTSLPRTGRSKCSFCPTFSGRQAQAERFA